MYRICVLTQTRATGLASSKAVERTINEFIDTVTTQRAFEPDTALMESIDWVLDNVVSGAQGGNPQFRISMSTSACTESSRKNEGKFGYLKKLKKAGCLPDIPKFSPENKGSQLGNWAFWTAYDKINSSDPEVFKTNIAGIRENGKVRVVTSGSFYKDAFLQPFSHMTIQSSKVQRSLKDGLGSGRLGWRFIERLNHLDPVDGHVLFEKHKLIMSVDWRKATDLPTAKSAHAITSRLLAKMNLSEDIRKTVECIWPGSKDMYINGKYVGQMINGIPMGDPLTKTNISLAHPICEAYADKLEPGIKKVHSGNGDDTVIIAGSDDPASIRRWFGYYNKATEMLGYEISQDDFFITSSWGTYCEEVFHIPVNRFNTVLTASKLKDNKYLPYLDHPKFRLVVDTKKDRQDYSSDIVGKVTLMGKDMDYATYGEEGKLFPIASACQDVCLGIRYEQKPMYIPRQIYSIGKMPIMWNPQDWANAILSMPHKVVNITIQTLRELMNEVPKHLTEHRSVKSSERHFEMESVTEVFTIPDDDPIKQLCVVRREDSKKIPPGVLDRLVDSKHLTTSREVEAFYMFMKRIETMEQEQHADLFDLLKTKVSELREYSKDEILRVVTKFRQWFFDNKYLLKRQFEVDYYYTHHIDELRTSDPRTVDLDFDYIKRFQKRLKPDRPKERAEQELFEWFTREVETILADGEYSIPPTQILEDDPYILQSIAYAKNTYHLIVTDDRKLARLAQNKFVTKKILMMSIRNWVRADCNEGPILDALKESLGEKPLVHVDNGSLDAFLYKTDIVPEEYPSFGEQICLRPVRTQEDIWDVYLAPITFDSRSIYNFVEDVNRKRTVWSRA